MRMIFAPFSLLRQKSYATLVVILALCTIGISQDCVLDPLPVDQLNLTDCDPVLADCVIADLQVDSFYLVPQVVATAPCVPGDLIAADLFAVINNQSEFGGAVGLFGNLEATTDTCEIARCNGVLIPLSQTDNGEGVQHVSFGSVVYTCGDVVVLTGGILVAGPVCPITCMDAIEACSYAVPSLNVTAPVFPDECAVTVSVTCNDNNPCTVEDFEIIDPFTGAICMPCTGSGTADCYVVSMITCDDSNPCTENDMQSIDACSGDICAPCSGTPIATCSIFINQACNDNDPCTDNDVIVLDACTLSICVPCAGTPIIGPVCDPNCFVYNPTTCSCDPITPLTCDDNDCSTIDSYDPVSCECVYIDISPDQCDDGLCYTNDYLDPLTCNCVNEPVVVDCNDNDCSTQDIYNYNTCNCEYVDVCTNVSSGGWIGYEQGNCSAFDPVPIQSLEPATGGCGDIQYMWLQSPENVPYTGAPNSSWTLIPGEIGLSYDPPYIASGVMCFLRCARTESCLEFPGESNVVCITVGGTEVCNDWDCTTEDYFNPNTCECEYTTISTQTCNDNNCGTTDSFNAETCECEYTAVCNNVTFPGTISSNQVSCGPFNPEPINSTNLPAGGCGDIEYIWIQSNTNVFSNGGAGTPWSTIPGATGASYDPGFLSQTTYFRRCARSSGCYFYIGESNIITIEVTQSETCDDGNCNTIDTYDPLTCECTHIDYTPVCDDNDCNTLDTYDALTCTCSHTPIAPPDCDDNDCNTLDAYDALTCNCVYTIITPADCDDNNCATTDLFDVLTCTCVNIVNPPLDCDDNDCSTLDVYSAITCECEYTDINLPDCDDDDCTTIDTYDPLTCECVNSPIEADNCDDNNCNTQDSYDTTLCECVYTDIPPPDCDDLNCNTVDSYNGSTCLCENIPIEIPDCDDNDCTTEDIYDVTTCSCVNTLIPPPDCDDNNCNTVDSYDDLNCNCINEVLTPPDCDDNDCSTEDIYNTTTCECMNTLIQIPDCDDNDCNTNDFYDVSTCACINDLIPPPDCNDNNCNTVDTYNSSTCLCENIADETPDCDDNDCGTEDSYDTVNCECINETIPPPDCDDNDCGTEDSYDTATCECVNEIITPIDCDDNDCGTEDSYDTVTCECINTIITPLDCDDNDCGTEDSYDTATCECVNEIITPLDCDDNDCGTEDSYDTATCECINTVIPPPDCDDNNCGTEDSYDSVNCECINETIPPPDCDDNDCNTMDVYNALTCTCEYTVVPLEIVCNTVGTIEIFLDADGNATITADDIDDGSTAGCDGTPILSLDITAFSCNNIGENEVKLTVTSGTESECCTAIVTVSDAIFPTALAGFCPDDVTINCDDDISNLSVYGQIDLNELDDNCPLAYTVDEAVQFNLDACGAGTIVRTLTLLDIPGDIVIDVNGNQIVCTHTITLIGNAAPLTLADITWPDSPINIDCNDPVPTSDVVVDESGFACANITTTVDETISSPNGDCELLIERTFTVTDNCQTPGVAFMFTQVINVTDDTAPVIGLSPDDLTVDLTGEPNQCSAILTLEYSVTDDCVNPEDLILSLDAPGLISQSTVAADGTVSFEVEFCSLDEDITITFTASDACGNVSTDVMEVSVIGEGCITYSCQKFIYALGANGETEFISNDFPVVDNLCEHITVDISYDALDVQDTLLVLNCDSIIANGSNPNINQFLYFWIDGQLIDSCRVVIFFSNDPNGDGDESDGWQEICGLTTFGGTVSGTVSSIMADPVPNVQVSLEGSEFPSVLTGSVGDYIFPLMEYGGNYIVKPKKDDEHLNGVSTLDIILIQRHILGLDEFDSPYKYIAADVNKSRSVTALDLIHIRKLILGVNNVFPNNTSWRMIDSDYEFTDTTDPLKSEWSENHVISEFANSKFIEFTGIKVGDVNGTAVSGLQSSSSSVVRSDNSCELGFEEATFVRGDYLEVDLVPNKTTGLQGLQFTIRVDPSLVQVEDIIFNDGDLCDENNVYINDDEKGLIRVSWNSFEDLSGKEALFTLRLKAKEAGALSGTFSISEEAIPAESYYDGLIGDLQLVPKSPEQGNIVLYQNRPNPWMESTNIQYYLPKAESVELSIYSINGQLIKRTRVESQKGLNTYELESADIKNTGIFYYELTCNKSKQIKKMLILE